ncbi:archaemetzincin [Desulfobacula phenolica]|uniref:Archaemetzincin n=2 Tax=Desulfobacula phenolica TaxID=90732 RepID=A0A1H2DNF4_9BACT|nr:archaemetzincin [Desulfobacula phenolica]
MSLNPYDINPDFMKPDHINSDHMNSYGVIIISPVGDIPSWITAVIAERVKEIFRFETRVSVLLEDIFFAYDRDRDQYYSTRILEELATRMPEDCIKLLAVTQEDLFIPILTHVYGEAQLGGRTSIISLSRLMEYPNSGSREKSRCRIVKEAVHELGHTFDLRHCEDEHCMMHYCRKLEDVDHKSDRFCRYCKIFLSDSIKSLGV